MKFIKLPNKIFSLNLSPIDILVFAGLKHLDRNNDNHVIARAEDIASVCNLHRNSVAKAIKSLEASKIIHKVSRYSDKGYRVANSYYLAGVSRKYFMLPSNIFTYNLAPSAFVVFCYMIRCANKSKRSFPSLKKITAHANICVDTTIAAIKVLVSNGLLSKQHYITLERDYGCNNYTLATYVYYRIKGYIKKKVARLFTVERTTRHLIYDLILQLKHNYVNGRFYIFFVSKRKLFLFYLGVLEKMCNLY
ncbi:MAG: helix-turn-helix domain-containing protein [Oscillospiraceae bacterium]